MTTLLVGSLCDLTFDHYSEMNLIKVYYHIISYFVDFL